MYGREYQGRTLRFEASGGLMHAALVMQDKETDSYWSIMTGDSISGDFKGTRLLDLGLGEKAQWGDWKRRHPDTLALSVGGREHMLNNPYDNYFRSEEGFRRIEAKDKRLKTKEAIFSFHLDGAAYAIPFSAFEGDGATFRIGELTLFLHRPRRAEIFQGTLAFRSDKGFEKKDGEWREKGSSERFDPGRGGFRNVARLEGFDTFWYNWSLTNPTTKILR